MARISLPSFQLANPYYIGALVTFYTVENGAASTTLASLYAGSTGTTRLKNPQQLDGEGKFPAPVYVDDAVIGVVIGPNVESGQTGILNSAVPIAVAEYESVTQAALTTVAVSVAFIRVAGYAAAGDGGSALFVRVGSQPSHAGKFQTVDGAWWELTGTVVTPEMFGAKTIEAAGSNFDSATAINNAISFCSAKGGGTVRGATGTYYLGTFITMRSFVTLRGNGRQYTTFKLGNGVNVDVLVGLNAYSLFGTDVEDGITGWSLEDCTIDGTKAANTVGSGLAVYGYHYRISHVTFKNCAEYGMRTDGGTGVFTTAMECTYEDILIDTTGKHGWLARGSHDSAVDCFTVIDASQASDAAYCGVVFIPGMNARVKAMHVWHRSSVANRVSFGFQDLSSGSNFSVSHFEGARTACVSLDGNYTSFADDCMFYNTFGTVIAVIRGAFNTLRGTCIANLGGSYSSGHAVGVTMGFGSDNCTYNVVDVLTVNCYGGAIDFTHSLGHNRVTALGYDDGLGSPSIGYAGSPGSGDYGRVEVPGASSNKSWASVGNIVATGTIAATGAISSASNIKTTGGAIGYDTGSGGAVTQASSKSTGVTLNKTNGTITMNAASLSSGAAVGFTLTNSTIAATDVVPVSIKSGATADSYRVQVDAVAAGSCRVSLHNITGGALAEAVVLSFFVFKAVAA